MRPALFRYIFFILGLLAIVGWGPFSFFSNSFNSPFGSQSWINNQIQAITSQASNINPTVLKIGLTAYLKAREEGLDQKQLLTVVDYSKPSGERRLWVIDLKNTKVLFNTWVSHGKNSGMATATSFSNRNHSLKSSLGVFITEQRPYVGGKGYALRIQGLEPGINDNVYRRDIIFHGAWYANPEVAKERGMLGRSWGCLAVGQNTIKPLVETIKNNTLVVAYYPDQNWLHNSAFLNSKRV